MFTLLTTPQTQQEFFEIKTDTRSLFQKIFKSNSNSGFSVTKIQKTKFSNCLCSGDLKIGVSFYISNPFFSISGIPISETDGVFECEIFHFENKEIMNILIFAGAGISAESGLTTFRDQGGIWTQNDLNEVCNYQVLLQAKHNQEQRKKIFDFYNACKQNMQQAKPNIAHEAIAKLQKQFGEKVKIFTSNVDNLFEQAGCENVTHVHGNLDSMLCTSCGNTWAVEQFNHEECCPTCSSRQTKPNVVFFGENAPEYSKMYSTFSHKRVTEKDIVLVIGTSFNVIGAEVFVQRKYHDNTFLINKEPTCQDGIFNHVFHGNATQEIVKVSSMIDNLMEGV